MLCGLLISLLLILILFFIIILALFLFFLFLFTFFVLSSYSDFHCSSLLRIFLAALFFLRSSSCSSSSVVLLFRQNVEDEDMGFFFARFASFVGSSVPKEQELHDGANAGSSSGQTCPHGMDCQITCLSLALRVSCACVHTEGLHVQQAQVYDFAGSPAPLRAGFSSVFRRLSISLLLLLCSGDNPSLFKIPLSTVLCLFFMQVNVLFVQVFKKKPIEYLRYHSRRVFFQRE